MKLLIFLVFIINALLTKNVALSTVYNNPTNLAWLFGINEKSNEIQKETRTVCQTEECQKIGICQKNTKVIVESMDKSLDPCDDFYEYACGKWAENNPIPNDTDTWSLWDMMERNIEHLIQEIFDAGPKDDDIFAVKLAKRWYMTCVDTDAMEEQGLDPLVFTLSRIGGWPITMDPDEWNEDEYTWQKVDDQYARLTGRNAFHDVRVYESNLNDSEGTVIIDTPHLPRGSYILWSMFDSDSDEEEESDENPSDEDPSNEEKHSDERKGSQEPGSEGDDKDDDNNHDESKSNDDDGDDDDNNGNDDNDIDTSYSKNFKRSKSNKKLGPKKSKKSSPDAKRESNSHAKKKYSSQKTNKHRLKRAIAAHVNSKRSYFVHRNKLNKHKDKRNNLDNANEEHTSTTPESATEEPSDDELAMKMRQEYVDYISKVARAIVRARDLKISEEQINKDVQDLIDFQISLVDISFASGEDLKMTIDDFQEWYDNKEPETSEGEIDWGYKISELFDEAGVYVDNDLEIEVNSPDYFEALVSLLNETPTRTIVNYIHWNFLSQILHTTTGEMRELYNSWQEIKEDDEKRSSTCIKNVQISEIVSYEYVRQHFSDHITKTAMDMIDDIQKEVEYQIKEAEWMDEDTKDFILAKLVNMKNIIGHPDWYRNTTIVKRFFKGLNIGKSYYENTLSFTRYTKWKELRKLEDFYDDDIEIWWTSPLTVNAFFAPDENSILITAADFQSPFFADNRPHTINFGIIGVIMGHEVNHGFDTTGHLFDKRGNYMDWLSSMAEAYGKRAECFVDQFNNYQIDKMSDDKIKDYGNQTAGENIADTMGLQAAFRAYRRRQRECGQLNAALPSLEDFTNDQLFFLSFANLWCEATKDPIKTATGDSHSIGRLRVIGSVSNSNDFAKAFNCPVGSAMNPEKKCSIWK